MRTKSLIVSDIRFQYRYGFYFIYLVFSVLYIGILFALPESWRRAAALLMIFTDPAAMGLFFMGAIVLFEKSERVLNSIAVSPVKPLEYVVSKLVSIGLIATLVACVIGFSAGIVARPIVFVVAVFLCSCLFSAAGLIVASKITTLNQFIIAAIPAEIIIVIPAVLWMFWFKSNLFMIHPGVSMLMLCSGEGNVGLALLSLLIWTAFSLVWAVKAVSKMLKSVGGIKL
ncbi:MAG: ABC transporter permease [Eubacteriales bacterium]